MDNQDIGVTIEAILPTFHRPLPISYRAVLCPAVRVWACLADSYVQRHCHCVCGPSVQLRP